MFFVEIIQVFWKKFFVLFENFGMLTIIVCQKFIPKFWMKKWNLLKYIKMMFDDNTTTTRTTTTTN